MLHEPQAEAATLMVPGVVSLAASSRRTLKHDASFAMFDELGDVPEVERSPMGLFHCDTRYLSRLTLTLEGHRPLVLGSTVQPDNITLDVDTTNPDIFHGERLLLAKDTFHLARSKFLWDGACHELVTVASYAERPIRLHLAYDFDADFADLFEIRGYRRSRRGRVRAEVRGPAEVAFVYQPMDGVPREARLCFDPAPLRLSEHRAEIELTLDARARRSVGLTVECRHGERPARGEVRYFPVLRRARRVRAVERARGVELETSNVTVNGVLSRAAADLAMLVTDTPHGPYPYAGVPWFSTVFGRDGILTAIETLWLDPSIARGVLRFLAAHQATAHDPAADAEPGKILHEQRECELARLGEVPFGRYYGSIDATPLFVALAGLYWQRTRDRETAEAIWPHVRAALEWIDRYGDRDGDGFVEYGRMRDTGLANQGWKDSEDSVMHADGRLARAPIALCEVQGYVFLARRVAAQLAADLGDMPYARELHLQSEALRSRFEAAFWCERLGTYALALDGDKRPCEVRTSNAGQVLFTGIALPEHAARIAQQLMTREFFTGWGVRTLSSREARFNPTSYHNGSIWPHDNALIGLGLAEYGHEPEALAVATALFDAAAHMHLRRLPELFCGFERRRGKAPTLYPVACAPQAWAACAPFALLQACLGMEVDAAADAMILRRPRLPSFIDWLTIRNLRIAGSRLDVMLRRDESSVAVSLLAREGEADVQVLL